MSDLGIGDLGAAYGLSSNTEVKLKHSDNKDRTSLDMEDFLNLMMVSLQNQSIDSTMDTSDMMNQMVQMSVMQAISDISTLVEDSTTLNYAASLVGKDVTIGKWVGNQLQETTGTVVGTGTLGGKQVIFLEDDDNAYYLNEILGIGKLPEKIVVPGTEEEEEKQTEVKAASDTYYQNPFQSQVQTPVVLPQDNGSEADEHRVEAGFEVVPGE